MDHTPLLIEEKDSIIRITFNRPESGNQLTPAMWEELAAFLEQPKMKFLVLSGANNTFSKGRQPTPKPKTAAEGQETFDVIGRANKALKMWPLPTIAAVEGQALGAGAGLVLHCDFAIAAEDAMVGFPEIIHGIAPAIVASYLPDYVGYRNAIKLLLTGKSFSSKDALQMGLVTDVVASGKVTDTVDELIAHFQTLNAEGLAATKKSLIELPDYPRADRMHEGISRVVAWQLR